MNGRKEKDNMKKANGNQAATQVTETSSVCQRANSSMPLESWKEIAGYFNRSVRTAQRWEVSEGMPVHRHRHGSGGSPFAYGHELDAWRAERSRQGRAVSKGAPIHRATISAFPLEQHASLQALLKEILRQLGETPIRSADTPTQDTTHSRSTSE